MAIETQTPADIQLAIGRLLRILSRPAQPDDVADYHRLRKIILDASESQRDHRPNYARQRLSGAQGD